MPCLRKALRPRDLRAALERVGGGLWRLADHRRQRRAGIEHTTSRISGTAVGADYRFSPFTLAGFALAGGGTNFSVANGLGSGHSDLFQAGAFIRHTVGAAYISARWPMAGRTSPPTAPSPSPASTSCRRDSTPMPFRAASKAAIRFVTPSWASASRLTPPRSSPPSICRPMPSRARRRQHVRAGLWREDRHRHAQRTRHPHRQILCDAGPVLTLRGRFAWAHDYNPIAYRRDLPDAARRHLRRQRRGAGPVPR